MPLIATVGGGTSFSAEAGTSRPFSASWSGLIVITNDGYVIDGASINSHLGTSTFHTQGTSNRGNTITLTAANGDTLIITTTATGQAFITGGTGRFASASGTLLMTFNVGADLVIVFTQEGVISY